MRDIHGLVRTATGQQGLLTIRQARELGFNDDRVAYLCRSGVIDRLRRGVYRLAASPDSYHQRLGAVCLSGSPPAVASHRSAIRLWGMRTVDDVLEATVRRPRTLRIEGAVIHRSSDLEMADVTSIDGIPVTSPVRTICDAGLIFPESEVRRILDHAVATELVTIDELWTFRRRVGKQGRNGVGALHLALASLPGDAALLESGPEVALLRLCADHDLPLPAVQFPIVVQGRRFRADLAYPEARVLLEYDGFVVHTTHDRFVGDRRRQNALLLDGWTILRFAREDMRDRPGQVASDIRRAIAASGCGWTPDEGSERA